MAGKRTDYDMNIHQAEALANSLARALNAAGIPCVLWGDYLLSAHGVPICHTSLDFVVPDASLTAAREVITTTTHPEPLFPCPDTTTCPQSGWGPRGPYPAFHIHINGAPDPSSTMMVSLFVQSETLWFLPSLGASLARPREKPLPRYLALASDPTALPSAEPGFGTGPFDSGQTVVLVPKAHILLEALMRIMARDAGKLGSSAMKDFQYIPGYVEKRGLLDVDLLPEPFGRLYKAVNDEEMEFWDFRLALLRTIGIPIDERHYR